jgi:hypothetical protein
MKLDYRKPKTKLSVMDTMDLLRSHKSGSSDGLPLRIPRGWTDLLANFVRNLERYDPSITITRVRASHGGLTAYVDRGDATVYRMLFDLEYMSRRTCEECGRKGALSLMKPLPETRTLCPADLRVHLNRSGQMFSVVPPLRFFGFRKGSAKIPV